MKETIICSLDEEKKLIKDFRDNPSIEAQRICRMYDMSDLSRTPGNPVNLIVESILNLDFYKDFDIVQTPEIV